ncbi:MAG: tetratricopeptide repeat protein [Candidatus Methanomethylophilaceae archaeon]
MSSDLLLQNAENGEASAQYELGIAYCLGQNGRKIDFKEAAKWFQKAVDQGYLPAKRELGIMYLSGEGVEADASKAYPLIKEAAHALDPNAMYHLALMYEKGIGVEKDLYEAVKLLAYAASANYPGADLDAERVNDVITKERKKYLRSRPLLNLEISEVDVMAACCKPMYEDMLSEKVVVMDTFSGPQLIGEDENGNDLPLTKCPYCGKPVRMVPRDKKY